MNGNRYIPICVNDSQRKEKQLNQSINQPFMQYRCEQCVCVVVYVHVNIDLFFIGNNAYGIRTKQANIFYCLHGMKFPNFPKVMFMPEGSGSEF
jgi:hypothetical protein